MSAVLVMLVAPTQARAEPDGSALVSGRIEAGRAIAAGAFSDAVAPSSPANSCFRCHGFDGQANAAAGFPRLAGQVASYLLQSLRDYASGKRRNAIMGPIARSLSEQEMADVAAYYAAQQSPISSGRSPVAADVLQVGGAIAAVGNAERGVQACANCHGPEGSGIPPQFPYIGGQSADYLAAQLRAWRSGDRKSSSTGGVIMELISKRLSDEEISAVSAYYAALNPPSHGTSLTARTSRTGRATEPAAVP